MSIEVIRPGLLSTVQDEGRTGYRRYGIHPGGHGHLCSQSSQYACGQLPTCGSAGDDDDGTGASISGEPASLIMWS